jgi:membrane protease YdiL (CAAX protease family)
MTMLLSPITAPVRRPTPTLLACLAGGGLLLARPWLVGGVDDPVPLLVAAFVTIGVVGAWWPVASCDAPAPARTAARVVAVGVAAFAVGRLVAGGTSAAPGLAGYVVLNSLAAVAEEAFFRRLVYDALAAHGTTAAVLGSAGAFAVVHVTVWGLWVLPLDLAAGLLLSWQRSASGRWSVPAVTHVFANLVAVLR